VTFLSPSALYFALAAGIVVLLALFRTKERRREVSALFLWEGLREDPRTRAARRRIPFDLLLLLQIATVLALALALARPAIRTRASSLSALAIVVDGSASMSTWINERETRYAAAIEEASRLVASHRGARTSILQLSSTPAILFAGDRSGNPSIALSESSPTASADGTLDDLIAILGSVGGAAAFERVVFVSDHPLPEVPAWLETAVIVGGRNASIDAFSARENPNGPGVLVFIRTTNHTAESISGRVRIDDGSSEVSLSVFLQPGASEAYVLPFPTTRATTFTATLEPSDDFLADNVRHFALKRPIDLRIHWIGTPNRYLLAALEAAIPVSIVDTPDDANLTVVYGTTVPGNLTGNLLLVHGDMPGVVRIGADVAAGDVLALAPDHPLLAGVRADALRVASIPAIETIAPGTVVLAAEETPLLVEFDAPDRTITFVAPDLLATNLPITVDFPILIRNLAARLVRIPAPLSHGWSLVGEPIPFESEGERVDAIVAPAGRSIDVADALATFTPRQAGIYRVVSSRGTYPLAVNVSPSESATVGTEAVPLDAHAAASSTRLHDVWWILAVTAAILLAAEACVRARRASATGGTT